MNFALTSIALGSINVTNYLQRFDQRQPAVPTVVNQFELSVYFHNEQTHFWNQINSSYSICKFGLDDFIVQDGCVVFSDDDSCVRFDASTNAIWLSADVAGSAPLWYAVEGDHVIITTDLLLAYHSGFTEPTALGPGQTMQLDLNTNELVDLYFRRSHVCTQSLSTSPRTVIPEVYSRYVLQRGITSLKSSLERSASPKQQSNGVSTLPKRLYTVEVDRMDSSSLLLDCMLDAMHVNRAVRDSRPLVTDSAVVDHPLFQAVMDGVSKDFLLTVQANVREPSFYSMAIDRWNLCQAASVQESRTLLSHDMGMSPRPVAVYLQNLFCNLLNVTVVYPFRNKAFIDAVWSTMHAKSYLHEAVELLRSPRLLSDTTAAAAVGKAATTVYMEAVCNISSHGANKLDLSDLQGCSGASCVDRIIVHTSINATANENATAILSSLVPSSSEIAGSKVEYRPTAAAGGGGSAEQSTNTDTDGTTRFIPNSLLNILSSVQPHATAEGIIVLLLVTKGYADMLTNFLCSAHKIHFRHFLILTHDQEIQDIAREFNVNFYTPHSSFEDVPTDADFGTVQYQSLVFSRTELAMELLLSGFQPIIADVDTVWLSNPLEHLPWSPAAAGSDADGSTGAETGAAAGAGTGAAEDGLQYDVAITDDNGEVCGCFIALRNTDNAVRFWNEVYVAHRALIATALSSGNIKAFDESEQKIVTQLIYRGQYKSTLLVLQLPAEIFPSGYAYFNTQTHRVQNNQPAVVHNNFIVGRGLKKARFQRYGMWSSLKPAPDRADSSDLCESDVAVATYLKFFASASRNISIPSLNMYLPVHNGAVGDLSSMMVHISAEGPVRVRHNGATSDFTFPSSKVYVDNNPPSFMEGNTVVFAVLNMSANVNYSSLSLTVTTNSESVALSADVASFQDSFATDREGRFHDLATEVVLRNQRELREAAVTSADALTGAREGYSDGLPLPYKSASAIGGDNSYEEEHPTRSTEEEVALSGEARPSSANRNPDPIAPAPPVSSPVPAAPVPAMSYSIRVITYKRAASLRRLLTSLASAEYMSYNNISLYISVDYPRDEQEQAAVAAVRQIADNFEWKFGPKEVKVHEHNLGLVNQWYNIWQPNNPHEAAFVFEDDMEVSPFFFVWAARAADKYYRADSTQIELQKRMLTAVREMKRMPQGVNTSASSLKEYARSTAGKPLLYGFCLQKQHLDPNHYPRKLSVKNNYRVFLYSLVGSWGPLLLPYPWQAFREWWAWRLQQQLPHTGAPRTENLVTNYFLSQNPNIWTPWHIRFAYETGAKCLYPNLPGDHALVVNHREQGENYVAASGPDGRLLDRTLLHSLGTLRSPAATDSKSATDVGVKGVEETTVEGGASSHQLLSSAVEALNGFVLPLTPSENDVLKWSLLHFPPMSTVARFQYDFNLRRAGALGADKAHSLTKDTPQGAELSAAWNKVGQAIELCTTLQQRQSIDLDRVGKSYSRMIAATEELSAEHWVHVVDMVEKVIIPGAHIVHFSYTPLVALLPAPHNNYTQTLVLESAQDIEQPWEEALLQAGYRNKSAYFVHKTRLISQPSGVTAGKYSLAVLDTRQPAIATGVQGKVWTEQLRGALSSSSSPVEHLLVVGACSAAPTDLSVYYGGGGGSSADAHYVMVEDVCSIGSGEDLGAVLYRNANCLGFPVDRRFAVSVRVGESLQSRTLVDSAGLVY